MNCFFPAFSKSWKEGCFQRLIIGSDRQYQLDDRIVIRIAENERFHVTGEADEDGIVRYQPGVGGIGIGLRNGNNIIDENGDAGSSNGGGIFNKSSYTNGYGRYGSRTPNGWTDKLGNGTGSRVLFEAGETVGTAATALIQDVCAFRWRGFEGVLLEANRE